MICCQAAGRVRKARAANAAGSLPPEVWKSSLERALVAIAVGQVPPPGWESRVLAASRAQPPSPRRWRWWAASLPSLAAAATVVVWLGRDGPPAPLDLAVALERGGEAMRTASPRLGDVVRAAARGGVHRAIWIYGGNGELLVACPGPTTCQESSAALIARLPLLAMGRYSVVALSAVSPLPAPAGLLDPDVAAAERAGAEIRIERLSVR